jgi:hypothetical protein
MAMDERWWMEGVGWAQSDGSQMDVGRWTDGGRTNVGWMDIERTDGRRTNVGRMDVRCGIVVRPGALQQWYAEANLNFFFLLDVTVGSGSFKSLQGFLCLFLCLCKREKKKKKNFIYSRICHSPIWFRFS